MFEKLMIAHALCVGGFVRPSLCRIDGDGTGGGGDGDGEPKPKTFTQEEVNRIAAKQKAEGEKSARAAAEAAAKEQMDALNARIQELELAGKSQAERDAHERKIKEEAQERTRKAERDALQKERDEAKAAADAASARLKSDRQSRAVTDALHSTRVIADAVGDAAESFQRLAKFETDEETGEITSIIYGGKSYAKLETATKQFLQDKPHFAQAIGGGGTGSKRPNTSGSAGAGDKPLWQRSREELLEMDRAEQQSGK